MKVFNTAGALTEWVNEQKAFSKSVGFVPTMGALHHGHRTLVDASVKNNDITVVSVFINPTQFNDKADLNKYPRTPDKDLEILQKTGCNACFMPDYDEVYGLSNLPETYDLGGLDQRMEGKHRPGHFNGVAMVVHRLFQIIPADRAYFGQKDFQQLAIIKHLVRSLNIPVIIVSCPIIRENDGLAMSSRNALLESEYRAAAPLIFEALDESLALKNSKSVSEVKEWVFERVNNHPLLSVVYYEIINDIDLKEVNSWDENNGIFGCIAVQAGKIRLIDNIRYNL